MTNINDIVNLVQNKVRAVNTLSFPNVITHVERIISNDVIWDMAWGQSALRSISVRPFTTQDCQGTNLQMAQI
jgi:hypothetical protein